MEYSIKHKVMYLCFWDGSTSLFGSACKGSRADLGSSDEAHLVCSAASHVFLRKQGHPQPER